jgi:hypothetical protein
MYENDIGCLVIVKRKMAGLFPVGIITERDIVWIIGSTPLFVGQAAIREFMSSPLVTVSPNTSLSYAINQGRDFILVQIIHNHQEKNCLKKIELKPNINSMGIICSIISYHIWGNSFLTKLTHR